VRLQRRVEELQMDRVRVQHSVRAALNACPTALVEFCRACKPYSVFRSSIITQPKPPASLPRDQRRGYAVDAIKLLTTMCDTLAPLTNATLPSTVTPLQRFYARNGVKPPRNCTPPLTGAPSPSSVLFVIPAHVPNKANCGLLWATLHSLACFHPDEHVLLVDNDSPFDNVRRTVSKAERPRLLLQRCSPSHGPLGAWAAADKLLQSPQGSSYETVVLLQHSTRLLRPFPLPLPVGCAAVTLMGGMHDACEAPLVPCTPTGVPVKERIAVRYGCAQGPGMSALSAREKLNGCHPSTPWMQMASRLAGELGILCNSSRAWASRRRPTARDNSSGDSGSLLINFPSATAAAPSGAWDGSPSLAFCPATWHWAFHFALGFSRAGWQQWRRFGLWPVQPEDVTRYELEAESPTQIEGETEGETEGIRARNEEGGLLGSLAAIWNEAEGGVAAKRRGSELAVMNQALEILAGVLGQHMNGHRRGCIIQEWFGPNSIIDKGHGSTHAAGLTREACDGTSQEHSWQRVNSLSGLPGRAYPSSRMPLTVR